MSSFSHTQLVSRKARGCELVESKSIQTASSHPCLMLTNIRSLLEASEPTGYIKSSMERMMSLGKVSISGFGQLSKQMSG
jgi:hypothetical protein